MMIAFVQVKSLCFDHSGTYLAVAGSDVRYSITLCCYVTDILIVFLK